MKLDGIMIWVKNVPDTVAFYEKAFGFELQMMDEHKQYAQMKTGETTLSFADETAAEQTGIAIAKHDPANDPAAVQLALVADDVQAAFQRALDAGATQLVELREKPWGQTLGYLRDNNGCIVEVSSPAAW